MGMFNDNVSANRTIWTYNYKGFELTPYAKKLLAFHSTKEIEARNKTADMLRDVNVNQNDSRFVELKRDITTHGTIKEQCQVFIHQFQREPDKEFELGLGDVTFFGLNEGL